MSSDTQRVLRVLFLEDNQQDREMVEKSLAVAGLKCEFIYATTEQGFSEALNRTDLDLILCDCSSAGDDGTAALKLVRQLRAEVPFIFISGLIGAERGVEGLKDEATDYVLKHHIDRLAPAIKRVLRETELISDRNRAESALRSSEQRLRVMFEYAPDACYLHDLQGNFIDGNRAAEELIGYPREEMIGSNLADLKLLDQEGREKIKPLLARSVLGKASGPTELKLTRRDGTSVTAEVRTYPVKLQDQVLVLGIARDITERRQAEEQLRLSEERFRSVWENSLDGMRLTDRRGLIVAVNEAYCRLVKLSRERLLGQLFSVAYYEHGSNDGIDVYHRRFESGSIIPHLTARAKLWNGEELDLDISSSFIELASERKLVLSIFRDITEQKNSELLNAAFSKLGQRLSAANTARAAGEIIVDIADQLFGWDATWFGLYWPAQDRLDSILSLDLVDGRRCETTSQYEGPSLSSFARRVLVEGAQLILKERPDRMLDGSFPFGDEQRPSASIMGAPIRYGATAIGLISVQSYTPNAYNRQKLAALQALADHCGGALERIRVEENLKLAQERLSHLLAESPAVIYSLRFHGDTLVPAWRSRYIQQLLGFSAEETCEPLWFDEQLHPDDRGVLVNQVSQLLAQKRIVLDYRIRHKNGEYRWVRDEQRLAFDAAGEPVEVVGSWVDITERKALEDLLRQSQKMEAVGQLAGGVAHDFNNLLLVIRGNAELLLMGGANYTEPAKECLKQIVAAVERSANLTRQLLAFSRKQVMQSRPLLINEVIANLARMLKRLIGEHIDLQCHYREGLPQVQADPGMIEQVLVNLVVNARDAMSQGGRLDISTDKVVLSQMYARVNPEARAGEFVCLSVRDTGSGIAPEHLPRIFEPFFTTKELGKGTGLGLATAYGIVKQHQGWIDVSSKVGGGTTFTIYLPTLPSAQSDPSPTPAEAPLRGGTEAILLVEDDAAVRAVTRRVLESFGYRVHEASQAREAFATWRERAKEISLLLTDIVMPDGMNGRELADQLRAVAPRLKVIFVSGYSPDMAGKDTGFFRRTRSHFLQKPCSSRILLETVRHCLDEE